MEFVAIYGEFVPREAAVEVSVVGTVQDCIDKIDQFVKAGVKHFLLLDVGADPSKLSALYSKEIKPRFAQ